MNQHPMQPFHDMLERIVTEGSVRPNRTGIDTKFLPSQVLRFDLQRDGFPAITTKRLAFRSAVGELLGFFRGYDNAADFRSVGCKVWDGNANETPSWLANPARRGQDDLGRIYSKQWTDWRDWREVTSFEEAQALEQAGYSLIARDPIRGVWVFRRGINQLEQVLHTLMTNPNDRRMVVTGWRPDEFDQMALPPCHMLWSFTADTQANVLHLAMHQRSFDAFLAFNVAMMGVFLKIMARLSGFTAGTATMLVTDAHVYANHEEQVAELLSREHYPQPRLVLGSSIAPIQDLSEISGAFARIEPGDITLQGYESHPPINATMAV